jgi:hypothetical protein
MEGGSDGDVVERTSDRQNAKLLLLLSRLYHVIFLTYSSLSLVAGLEGYPDGFRLRILTFSLLTPLDRLSSPASSVEGIPVFPTRTLRSLDPRIIIPIDLHQASTKIGYLRSSTRILNHSTNDILSERFLPPEVDPIVSTTGTV